MNLHAFFSRFQWFKTLKHILKPYKNSQHFNDSICCFICESVHTSPLCRYLLMARFLRMATLLRYRTVSTNTENATSTPNITLSTIAVTGNLKYKIHNYTYWQGAAGGTSHQQGETPTQHLTWMNPHNHSHLDLNIWDRKYTKCIFNWFAKIFQ